VCCARKTIQVIQSVRKKLGIKLTSKEKGERRKDKEKSS